jgi:Leucine-rich repeat (LRR) protein
MANADVSDSTLNVLKGALKLKELDISGSLVTDAGLAVIATLPALEVLRIANCRITDAGFRDHLLNHPALLRIDVTGTAVSPELIREWRRANPERRAMQ